MFSIRDCIVRGTADPPIGEDGYIRFDCGPYHYGEIFPQEPVMDIASIYEWMLSLTKTAKLMQEGTPYILLRDIESYNTYLQFHIRGERVSFGMLRYDREPGQADAGRIQVADTQRGRLIWEHQVITLDVLRESRRAASEYCNELAQWTQNEAYVKALRDQISSIRQ